MKWEYGKLEFPDINSPEQLHLKTSQICCSVNEKLFPCNYFSDTISSIQSSEILRKSLKMAEVTVNQF